MYERIMIIMNKRGFPLTALAVGDTALVDNLCVDAGMRRRLLDLGMIPNTAVTALFRSPSGDPTAYGVRGAVIALRQRDAARICMIKGE